MFIHNSQQSPVIIQHRRKSHRNVQSVRARETGESSFTAKSATTRKHIVCGSEVNRNDTPVHKP